MELHGLLRTKIHLVALDGEVRETDEAFVLRTPRAPTFFHGTCLALKSAPTSFQHIHGLHRKAFGDEVVHRAIVWGDEAADSVVADAVAAGYESDRAACMELASAESIVPQTSTRFDVRPLDPSEWPQIDALMRVADGAASEDGDPSYRRFKEEIRGLLRGWIESRGVTWWGAFEGDVLVGQCGFARCDSPIGVGIGRFQAVEVHPEHRRRGVGSALVAAVARDGFRRLGCERILLEADPEGPAIGMYGRIGFERCADVHELLWSSGRLVVRPEQVADHADVRSVVIAAFGRQDEADLVGALRDLPGTIGLIAERDGRMLGQVHFSRVRVGEGSDSWDAIALAPMAVRPAVQRGGVGSELVRAGLDACREAGEHVVFVLGHPEYYPRFGFEPAAPKGLICPWDVPAEVFLVSELVPGALRGRSGRVRYAGPFESLLRTTT